MPELPEVQTIVNGLSKVIKSQSILKIDILNKKTLDSKQAQTLINHHIVDVLRRGKYIVLQLVDAFVVIHLRMTGQFFYFEDVKKFVPNKSDRVLFHLSMGLLVFRDSRKFATMKVGPDLNALMPEQGIDPFDSQFTTNYLNSLLRNSHAKIKAFLLKQDKIAGIGNIYADEALFRSHIHPESISSSLPQKVINDLHEAIQFVLQKGIESEGTSLGKGIGNYKHINGHGKNQMTLYVYGRSGQECLKCGLKLQKLVVASRGTTICQHCQKKYRP
jgi:formamidopyrimidine-DNA glycosylase